MKNFTLISESANHCQRNWSKEQVPNDILEELISVALNMPTKQNEEYYTLLASTDKEYNHDVYMHSYDPIPDILSMPFENRHLTNYNTQFRAPVLFQWLIHSKKRFKHGSYNPAGYLGIGISAGAVALAANSLNLKTGFGICLHREPLLEKINSRHNTDFSDIVLTLGIGYPDSSLSHNAAVRPNNEIIYKETYKKTVTCIRQ